MAYNEETAARISKIVKRRKGFVEKSMFGGKGYMHFGNFCCAVWMDYLVLRVGPEQYQATLQEAYVKKFDISGKKEIKGWVLVEPDGFYDDEALREWISLAQKFTKSLPPK